MKTLNKFRSTDKFNITAGHVDSMVVIAQHYSKEKNMRLIAVAHNDDEHDSLSTYTVRSFQQIDGRTALVDELVEVYTKVEVIEQLIVQHDSE